MNNFNFAFGAGVLTSRKQPTQSATSYPGNVEESSFEEPVTTMRHTRNSIKAEGSGLAERGNHDYEDVDMSEDMFTPRTADGIPAEGYDTSSTETFHGHENNLQYGREMSSPQHPILNEADDGIKKMGRDVAMIAVAMDKLRLLGVSHQYGVPELCVLGEQSAGKSSVIGALAGIHLPSGNGTSTRVPVQIKTINDSTVGATWTCKIHLDFAYDQTPPPRALKSKVTKIGSWYEKSRPDRVAFMCITDKSELKVAMEAAQMAILNPQHEASEFLPYSGSLWGIKMGPEQLEFSPNLIVLEVSEPGLQPLSFIDLPGIIQVHDKDDSLPDFISELVKHFIARKNTLLLCTLPMNAETQNSNAFRYVKEAKATDRCIGVLTKPDRLIPAAVPTIWLPLLRGKEGYKMGGGYYITKQPEDSGTSHAQAHVDEEAFFDNTPPWTTDLLEFREICGTKNLRDVLARKLASRIKAELPTIQSLIERQTADLDKCLKELPQRTEGDVQPKVIRQLQHFSIDIQNALDPDSTYFMEWRNLRIQFAKAVTSLMPVIHLKDQSDIVESLPQKLNLKEGGNLKEPVVLPDDDDESAPVTPTPVRPKLESTKKRPCVGESSEIPSKKKVRMTAGNANRHEEHPREDYFDDLDSGMTLKLRDITSTIRRFGVGDLPGDVGPKAKINLCKQSVAIWRQPMELLLGIVETQLENLVNTTLRKCLADYVPTDLYPAAKSQLKSFLDNANAKLKGRTEVLYIIESQENPFTINDEAFNFHKRNALDRIKGQRKNIRAEAMLNRRDLHRNKATSINQRADIIAKITDEQLGPDPFEKEIECIAHVEAHYKIASYRFADNVCQAVQSRYFSWVRSQLIGHLENVLKLNGDGGPERCRILAETIDPQVYEKREKLRIEKEALEQAHEQLKTLVKNLALNDRKQAPALLSHRSRSASIYDFPHTVTPAAVKKPLVDNRGHQHRDSNAVEENALGHASFEHRA